MKFELSRRKFLKLALAGSAVASVGGLGYSAIEAGWIQDQYDTLTVPRLPAAFKGTRIAFLTDIHHGPFTGLSYVKAVVDRTLALKPDLILLGGDFVYHGSRFIQPVFQTLSPLAAPLGVYSILGNHDHYHGVAKSRAALHAAGIPELRNTGVWLSKSGQRLRVCGVGDFWEDTQDLTAALADCGSEECVLLISHNPDFVETITDRRVRLVFSGHTHGGQVVLPVIGPPIIPSRFGQKYARGLIATPYTQVFVSRGLGTITPPLRFCCRPEINVVTVA